MRFIHFALALMSLSSLLVSSSADGQPSKDQLREGKKASSEEINRLVNQLGDVDFAKRVEARKQLEAIGEPAVGILKKAIESSGDAEIRTAGKAIVETIERKTSGLLRVFGGHGGRVNGVDISADGHRALSSSWDGTLRYWNLANGDLIREMPGHTNAIISVALSADGKRALTGSSDRTMRLWDLESGKEIRLFEGHPQTVWDVAFSPDGKQALSGCSDSIARLWDVASGKELLALETHKGGRAWTVAFTPDGRRAVTGGGNAFESQGMTEASLRLWDLTTTKEIRQFQGHTKDVRNVAISPDGKQLISGSFDGTMRLWDLQTGKEIRRFDGPGHFVEAVRFTQDGKRAICSYGPRVIEAVYDDDPRCSLRLWDLATGKELKQFKGHTGPVLSLAISRDGRFLVSGSADNSMVLWRVPSPTSEVSPKR
jgi:WD40 repeat protein